MGEVQPRSSESQPSRALTRREFLATFQFSQGDPALQFRIFKYLKYLHPELQLTDDDVAYLNGSCAPLASDRALDARRHSGQWPTKKHSARYSLGSDLRTAREVFNHEPEVLDRLLPDLLSLVILADNKYLSRPNGRGYVADGTPHYNPYKDPWRSDLCYFGFLGNTTGLPDFDQMFTDIVTYWHANPYREPTTLSDHLARERLPTMVSAFNVHHPLTPVTLAVTS